MQCYKLVQKAVSLILFFVCLQQLLPATRQTHVFIRTNTSPLAPERPNGVPVHLLVTVAAATVENGSALGGGSDSRKWQCSRLAALGKLWRTDPVGALQRDLCQKMVHPSWLQRSSFSAREKRARFSQEALSFTNPSQHCKCFSHLAPRRLGANCSNCGSWKKRGLESGGWGWGEH